MTRDLKLIGLCGYAGSGKDTAAEGLLREGWKMRSFAEPMKMAALKIDPIVGYKLVDAQPGCPPVAAVRLSKLVQDLGWVEAKKNPEVRRFLQRYGTEGGRQIFGDDCWVILAERVLRMTLVCGYRVVMTDVRFENEAKMVRNHGGEVVQIRRSGVGPVNEHASEAMVEPDAIIENDSTEAELQSRLLEYATGQCLAVVADTAECPLW